MKILIVGLLVFLSWSAISTYLYVCRIKGFCNETETIMNEPMSSENAIITDTLSKEPVIRSEIVPENLVIYFSFDKSEFMPDTKTDNYIKESNVYLAKNSDARIIITGHTDAIGTDEYNQALGFRRAKSVEHYFENRGVSAKVIITESRGEKEPADDNNTVSGRTNNRRAVITLKK